MNYIIDKTSHKSAYLQLYEQLRRDIVSGVYSFGDRLPSKRLLAEESGVSIITAEHALVLLCDEGYVEARQRSGYFVIFRSGDLFAVGNTPSPPVSHSRRPEYVSHTFPFSVMAKTMRRVLTDYGEDILVKSPNCGVYEFRQAISGDSARSRGITASPEQIIIGSGAEYLYGLIVALLGRDRVWAIEQPSYEKIEQVYKSGGTKYEALPLGNDGIESSALKSTSASVLHITPYRSFPSGVTASPSKRLEYLHWAEQNNAYIIEDDFESEFTLSRKSEETVFSLSKNENVIYLNTFSKTVSPSLRVGYMVLPPSMIPLFERQVGFFSCTVPAFEQYVLASLISDGSFERNINRVRRQIRRKKAEKP